MVNGENLKFILVFLVTMLLSCEIKNQKTKHSRISLVKETTIPQQNVARVGYLRNKSSVSDKRVKALLSGSADEFLNKEIVSGKSGEAEYFTTYLGKIEYQKQTFRVFKCFYTVQAAITKHGHSELIFVNNSDAYWFDMNGELPLDLVQDGFRYVDLKDTIVMNIEHFSGNDLVLSGEK